MKRGRTVPGRGVMGTDEHGRRRFSGPLERFQLIGRERFRGSCLLINRQEQGDHPVPNNARRYGACMFSQYISIGSVLFPRSKVPMPKVCGSPSMAAKGSLDGRAGRTPSPTETRPSASQSWIGPGPPCRQRLPRRPGRSHHQGAAGSATRTTSAPSSFVSSWVAGGVLVA